MKFEVNGKSYVLTFNRDEGRWYLLTPGVTGNIRAIPVINDDALGIVPNVVVPVGGGQAA